MVKKVVQKDSKPFSSFSKFPKVITHDKRLNDVEKELELFFSFMIYLKDKILALLIQLPPSMGIVEGMNGLKDMMLQKTIIMLALALELLTRLGKCWTCQKRHGMMLTCLKLKEYSIALNKLVYQIF